MPCASRSDGRTATVRSAVRAETSSRRPVKTIRSETARPKRRRLRRAAHRPPSPRRRWRARRPVRRRGSSAWPRSGTDGPSRARGARPRRSAARARGMPNSSRIRQAGSGRREAREIDAVRDDGEAGAFASLAAHLVLDARRRNDQPIHPRRERRQERDVLRRANPRGVDGGHDHRRAGGDRRASPDHLGAEHVGVDEVDLVVAQPAGELADGELVVGLVEDVDRRRRAPGGAGRRSRPRATGRARRTGCGRGAAGARCSSPGRRRCRRSPAAGGSAAADGSGTDGSADGGCTPRRRWRPRGRARPPAAVDVSSPARC